MTGIRSSAETLLTLSEMVGFLGYCILYYILFHAATVRATERVVHIDAILLFCELLT